MRRLIPFSLIFFALTVALFVLQMIPFIGIFLMFLLAMFWSVLLINAGMIGIAVEAVIGRVSRWWLVVPLVFYCAYWAVAAQDHMVMRRLGAAYDAANAKVITGFDPVRQALAFDGDGGDGDGSWLTQNYGLPVAYSANSNFQESFLSHRMMGKEICSKVREAPALRAAFVNVFGFHDGDAIRDRKMEGRFCTLSMPERPALPLVWVSRAETKSRETSLPITRVTTTITMPNGRQLRLLCG